MKDRKDGINELINYIEKMDDHQLRFILRFVKKLFFPEG